MTRLGVLAIVLAGCTGQSTRPPIESGTAVPLPAVATDAECTAKGRWEIAIQSAGGCPLPASVVLVGGAGKSASSSAGVPAMTWTLTPGQAPDGGCRHALEGVAGRFFTVHGALGLQGDAIRGAGESTPGLTAYSCSGSVEFSGRRLP